jgi:tRNA nucleotidyltransferase (CCA-adding enzyme)
MQTYLVGGAVRDALLGLPVQDRDWVVVGATPEAMVAHGFLPVGRDFPVFLHPVTQEEYALARTERKTAPGYRGFVVHAAPDVTLEQDLARRDITINSIAVYAHSDWAKPENRQPNSMLDGLAAKSLAQGGAGAPGLGASGLVDPFGGVADLRAKVLRHTTPAFREDPVRILRVARFAARFPDFSVAIETMQLMRDMVLSGEAAHLVPERVWQELAKGLMTAKPSRMFQVLQACGALAVVWPSAPRAKSSGMDGPAGNAAEGDMVTRLAALDRAAAAPATLPVRYACLCEALGATSGEAMRRVPRECSELAGLMTAHGQALRHGDALDAPQWMALLERCDALRRPERFAQLLQTCELLGQPESGATPLQLARELAQAAEAITIKNIADYADSERAGKQKDGALLGQKLRQARVTALAAYLAVRSG